jgi:hypothetical protein
MEDISKVQNEIVYIINQIRLNNRLRNKIIINKSNSLYKLLLLFSLNKSNNIMYKKLNKILEVINKNNQEYNKSLITLNIIKTHLIKYNSYLLSQTHNLAKTVYT